MKLLTNSMKLSIGSGCAAVMLAFYAIQFMPHTREIESIWAFLFKLLPFIFATFCIAYFDISYFVSSKVAPILICISFGIFFILYVPKLFFYSLNDGWENVYYLTLLISPVIILSLVFAYRAGGGSTGTCIRISFGMLMIMLSGLEDLAFMVVNDHPVGRFNPIPEVWDWIPHMEIRLGKHPEKHEAYLFIATHIVIAMLIIFYPFQRLGKLHQKLFG